MRVELAYNTEFDDVVARSTAIELGGQLFYLSGGTLAGRKQPDIDQKPNEDIFTALSEESDAVDDPMLAVFVADGASSQKPIPELGATSGARYASHTLKEMFEHTDVIEEPQLMLSGLNAALRSDLERFSSVDYDDLNSLPTATGTIGRFNPATGRLDIGHVGDSFAMAQYEDDTTTLLTNNLHKQYDQAVLRLMKQIVEERNITPREARKDPRISEAIMNMFQDTRNRPDGTGEGMINGDPNMDQYIHSTSLSLKGVKAVLF